MSEHQYSWTTVPADLTSLLSYELPDKVKSIFMSKAVAEADMSDRLPTVGAVIVNGDEVVGRGYRRVDYEEGTGIPWVTHAEAMALEEAGNFARGSVLYSTLEPCIVLGRAPNYSQDKPCLELIQHSGVSIVVIGLVDRDPRNFGQGITRLVESGIKVEAGHKGLEQQLYRLIADGSFTL